MRQFRFERLDVWQAARHLNRDIYLLSSRFPDSERFGLTSQLRRSSVSISGNIAEGSGRNSDKDFAHYLEQGYGSLMESASHLFLAQDLSFVSATDVRPMFDGMHALAAKLASLNRSLGVPDSKIRLPK